MSPGQGYSGRGFDDPGPYATERLVDALLFPHVAAHVAALL
jgi:hypothetical protein